MIEDAKRPIPTLSIDTKLIYERLASASVGDLIEYSELNDLVQRDIRNGAAGCFQSARRRVERLDGIVFGTVRGVGVKRLSDDEIVASGQAVIDKSRRAARRGYRRLGCVEFDGLSAESKVKHNTYQSLFSALVAVTKPSAVKKVETKVSQSQESLPLAATLEAFK